MNRYEALKARLNRREKIVGTSMLMLSDPLLLDRMNRPDLDFVLMDAEHGRFDTQNVIPMLHTLRMLGLPGFLRVQDCQYHLIAKAIDMGADGVMIPRVETVDQLRSVIDAVWFGPTGRKGAGGYAQMRPGETYEQFQKGRFVFCQIESPKGIEQLSGMIDAYGDFVDAFIIGPNDLSILLGTPFDTRSPAMERAVKTIFETCNVRGKSCGIFCGNARDARHYREMGCNVLWTASDMQFYMRGYEETMADLSGIE